MITYLTNGYLSFGATKPEVSRALIDNYICNLESLGCKKNNDDNYNLYKDYASYYLVHTVENAIWDIYIFDKKKDAVFAFSNIKEST